MKINPEVKKLIKVLGKIQNLAGQAQGLHGDDRNPDGFEKGQKVIMEIFNICLTERNKYPPM